MWNMFHVNNNDTRKMSLKHFIPFSNVSILDFERVNVFFTATVTTLQGHLFPSLSIIIFVFKHRRYIYYMDIYPAFRKLCILTKNFWSPSHRNKVWTMTADIAFFLRQTSWMQLSIVEDKFVGLTRLYFQKLTEQLRTITVMWLPS